MKKMMKQLNLESFYEDFREALNLEVEEEDTIDIDKMMEEYFERQQ